MPWSTLSSPQCSTWHWCLCCFSASRSWRSALPMRPHLLFAGASVGFDPPIWSWNKPKTGRQISLPELLAHPHAKGAKPAPFCFLRPPPALQPRPPHQRRIRFIAVFFSKLTAVLIECDSPWRACITERVWWKKFVWQRLCQARVQWMEFS